MSRGRAAAQRGATLIELVVSIVVLSVAVTGVLMAVTRTVSASADPLRRVQAAAIGGAYMEEILARAALDPQGGDLGGPEPGEHRAVFDDVNDYHGLSDRGVIDQNGHPVEGLEDWRVTVSVRPGRLGERDGQRVEVRVWHAADPDGALRLSAWRFR